MSDLLDIGASGVSAYRSALAAVGDNVANAETPGYARRSVRLKEAVVGSNASSAGVRFSGVRAAAVDRAWDDFRAAESRLAASSAGRADARVQWLNSVEDGLVPGERNVGSLIGDFFNTGTALAANPRDRVARSTMLAALGEVTRGVRASADALTATSRGIVQNAGLEVEALNDDMAALVEVNRSLRETELGRSSSASLLDERDRIIDRIASRIDVSVSLGENGVATLTLARASGVTLLDPASRGLVTLAVAADGRLALNLAANGTTVPLPASGGSLAGLVDVAASTADRRAELNAIAASFAASVNAWSAAGRDLAGNPGGPLLTIAAGAETLALATTDPAAIAAASSTADNGNLLDLGTMRGPAGAEARWASLVAGTAQALASAKAESTAASTRRDNAFAARDEIAGIDLDREAAELLRFQQAYNACARIVQVSRETVQSILDLF